MHKKIILTGGGLSGFVTRNLALVPKLKEKGYDNICYIGSVNGIEEGLIKQAGLTYEEIPSDKIHRNLSINILSDKTNTILGYVKALHIIKQFQPNIVFSTGSFVSLPVVMAAQYYNVPSILHVHEMTPDLAVQKAEPYITKICCTFPETINCFAQGKAVLTGTPIRKELLNGSKDVGLSILSFKGSKPILMIISGRLGSYLINTVIHDVLPSLLNQFDVVHICGKGNLDESLKNLNGYRQLEFIGAELKDLLAASDIVISHAGIDTICELLALKKPNLLIPIEPYASRGEQLQNAQSFQKQGFSMVLNEMQVDRESLLRAVKQLWEDRETYAAVMTASSLSNGVDSIIDLIERYSK